MKLFDELLERGGFGNIAFEDFAFFDEATAIEYYGQGNQGRIATLFLATAPSSSLDTLGLAFEVSVG